MESTVRASIVLNDMHRTHQAAYGFRSWILQDMDEPYEVVLNLFNDKESLFEDLMQGHNPNCCCRIQSYPPQRSSTSPQPTTWASRGPPASTCSSRIRISCIRSPTCAH